MGKPSVIVALLIVGGFYGMSLDMNNQDSIRLLQGFMEWEIIQILLQIHQQEGCSVDGIIYC